MQDELYRYVGGVIQSERGVSLEIGGMPDHVHLVARFRADVSVAEMLRRIKANSSKWLGERESKDRWMGWQTGYAAFSVSESQLPVVRDYVRNQERHHRTMSCREELVMLLKKHGVAYDERYLGA